MVPEGRPWRNARETEGVGGGWRLEWELLVFGALSTRPLVTPHIIWDLEWESVVVGS